MEKIGFNLVPHVLFAALLAVVAGICVSMGATPALTYVLCAVVVGFYVLVCWIFIPLYNRSLSKKIQDIHNCFTFSHYSGSRSVSEQLSRLRENIRTYMEKRRVEEDALRDRDTFRREFIGNLAHELKTPLFTSIRSPNWKTAETYRSRSRLTSWR